MNRHVVAGLLGLALAGCAQGRSVVSRPNPHMPAVEITPGMASIHESINRENPKVDSNSLRADLRAMAAAQEPEDGGLSIVPTASIAAVRPRPGALAGSVPGAGVASPPAPQSQAEPTPAVETVEAARPKAEAPVIPSEQTRAVADAVTSDTTTADAQARAADASRVFAEAQEAAASPQPDPEPVAPPESTAGPTPRTADPLLDYNPLAAAPASAEPEASDPAASGQGPAPAAPSKLLPTDSPPAPEAPESAPGPAAPSKTMPSPVPLEQAPESAPGPAAPSKTMPSPAPLEQAPSPAPLEQGPSPAPLEQAPSPAPLEQGPSPAPLEQAPASPGKSLPPAVPGKTPPEAAPAPAEPESAPTEPTPPTEQAPEAPPADSDLEGQAAPEPESPGEASKAPEATREVAPESTRGVVSGTGDRLLGPRPDIWPEIKLPPAATEAPRVATAPVDYSAMPSPTVVPPASSELPEVMDAPVAPSPEPIEVPAAPIELPEVTEPLRVAPTAPADPSAGGVAPQPDPFPSPEASRGSSPKVNRAVVASPPKVDPSLSRASTVDQSPMRPPAPLPEATPTAPVGEPRPLPIDAADLPVALPPLSGPEASNLRPSGRLIRTVSLSSEARTADEPTAVRIPGDSSATRAVFEAGKPAARIGDEVITLLELKKAITLRRKGMPEVPMDASNRYELAKSVLAELIDRAIVIQEAKRTLKNPKQIEILMTQADKIWSDEELPPLLRQSASANIHELKRKMEERGESLDEHRQAFRQEYLFRGFIEFKVGPRLKVELPEMRHYYLDHLREFDRPALISWREIVIDHPKEGDPDLARQKANEILARLLKGADFAAIARAESDGPNKSSAGAWQTSPGGYAVREVNEALDVLPIGQVSRIIEGPQGYHIVRVESRRPAGPAPFSEAQERIARTLRAEKIREESQGYLDRLRKETVVTTVFDDPGVTRASLDRPEGR